MREVIGYNKIDAALTTDKLAIQNDTRVLLQRILDSYQSGLKVVAVQLQDVHPLSRSSTLSRTWPAPKRTKVGFINEAEAYENDLIPRTRGEVAAIVNQAKAYKVTGSRRFGQRGFLCMLNYR